MKILPLLFSCLFLISTQISAQCPSTASFSYSINGLTVTLQNTSVLDSPSVNQVFYYWEFPENNTSNQQMTHNSSASVSHTYSAPGNYWINMLMQDSLNNCMDTASVNIYIPPSCEADFSYSSNQTQAHFVDQSTGTGLNYIHWNFGDGTTSTDSIVKNMTHNYPAEGVYEVCLVVMSNNCMDSTCVQVTVGDTSCHAGFTKVVDSMQQFSITLLNNSSNKNTHKYFWDFGDDSTSTDRNPTHEYDNFGKYEVCLTVIDSTTNCFETFCDSIGMDSTGQMFRGKFKLQVQDPAPVGIEKSTPTVSVNVFPNPASSQLTVSTEGMGVSQSNIKIMDIQGKEVLAKDVVFNGDNYVINLESIDPGVYFIQIENQTNSLIQKFVKQ